MRKPFYKKSHNAWYCEIGRRQIRLGQDKEEAFREYHRLMAGEEPVTSKTTVFDLVDQFLVWTQENREASTYLWYLNRCQSFIDHIGKKMKVSDLKPIHVDRWLKRAYPKASNTFQNGACRAVSRAFNWARKKGLLAASPLTGMERPAYEPKEAYLTNSQWLAVLKLIKADDPFLDLICFMKETGCRPQEARIVTARHWDRAKRRIILERKKSKGKAKRRVIRLNDKATEIVQRLALKRPDGELFRNIRNNPWTTFTVIDRFTKLEEKLGFEFFPYILRHTFCTDALLRGVDPMTVAILMGHSDATMVMRVYGHLVQHDEFLQQKLSQATGEPATAGNDQPMRDLA